MDAARFVQEIFIQWHAGQMLRRLQCADRVEKCRKQAQCTHVCAD